METLTTVVLGLCVLTLAFLWLKWVYAFKLLVFPPGPQGYPIIGNVFDIPSTMPWIAFQKMAKVHGDIMYFKVPMQEVVVLGSAEVVFDLLEKRSEIYSDRPQVLMYNLTSLEKIFPLMGYTPEWRYQRREFHQYFQQHEISKYQSVQRRQCLAFLKRTLDDPSQLAQHIRLVNTANILKIVYDMEINSLQDEYIQLASTIVQAIAVVSVPGKFLVEFFPLLRYIPSWLPGAYFQKYAESIREAASQMRNAPFDTVKKKMADGKAGPSMTADLLEKLDREADDDIDKKVKENHLRNITATAYVGAADTTTDTMQTFFVAMSLYPDVQQKARMELDRVVGPDRLPEFGDYENLIYTRAVVLETIRWMPVAPIGFPRRVTRDDNYRGFHIPKGATVLANVWAMLHNPEDFPQPGRFNPDRFIKDGRLNPDVRDPLTIAFGFGRRICPGRWFASTSIFLVVANALHTLNIDPILDKEGKTHDPFSIILDGLKMHYEHVPCSVTPRSASVKHLVSELVSSQE
ncbi:hypothetical protein QCA50_011525 [Cerrena zonata]|uniref:Cytochrome P450 n=1 Tax=Cerrena zonata TaxID=2478898 RepID=A0AAW0FYB7_9APHY